MSKEKHDDECLDKSQNQLIQVSDIQLTIEIPVMSFATEGLAIAIPPTALVTDTAGVRMPSAMVRPVPRRH